MHGLGENKLLAMKGRKRQVYLLSLLFISLFIGFLCNRPITRYLSSV